MQKHGVEFPALLRAGCSYGVPFQVQEAGRRVYATALGQTASFGSPIVCSILLLACLGFGVNEPWPMGQPHNGRRSVFETPIRRGEHTRTPKKNILAETMTDRHPRYVSPGSSTLLPTVFLCSFLVELHSPRKHVSAGPQNRTGEKNHRARFLIHLADQLWIEALYRITPTYIAASPPDPERFSFFRQGYGPEDCSPCERFSLSLSLSRSLALCLSVRFSKKTCEGNFQALRCFWMTLATSDIHR